MAEIDEINAALRAGRPVWGYREAKGALRLIPQDEGTALTVGKDGIARRAVPRTHRRTSTRPARFWTGVRLDGEATTPTPATAYTSPHIEIIQKAVKHFGITPEAAPKKGELVAYLQKQKLPDGTPVSKHQAEMMATFCRSPEAMKGGNKRMG